MFNKLISGAIVILVGISLVGEVSRQIQYPCYHIKENKQTYYEYVKERLEVERLMK